jgi:C1A family cysteine protease
MGDEVARDRIDPAELQARLEESDATWTAGKTPLTELPEEQRVLRLGYEPGPDEPGLEEQEAIAQANLVEHEAAYGVEGVGAPPSFDWRTGGWVTPIKNQGGCGSCVSFGTSATIETTYKVSRGNAGLADDRSEAQLFYCYGKAAGRNCGNGWWVPPALDACKAGLATEAAFPYTAGDQNCNVAAGWEGQAITVLQWHQIGSVADMKAWLSSRGALAACFTVYDDFFAYKSGVYHHVSTKVAGGHCISVVGYDDNQKCWICKNSWGTGWGESGFFKILYGDCGIDSAMWAVDSMGSWLNNTHVRGLWAIDQDRNAWAYIDGAGWRKVAADNDNIFFDILSNLAAAKTGNRPVNVYDEGGVIRQVYVF